MSIILHEINCQLCSSLTQRCISFALVTKIPHKLHKSRLTIPNRSKQHVCPTRFNASISEINNKQHCLLHCLWLLLLTIRTSSLLN